MTHPIPDDNRHYRSLIIRHIQEEVPGVKTFVLEPEDGKPLPYKAGQYLTLVHHSTHGEVRRSYSITSSPALQEPLTIGVKRIENGLFSRMLIDNARVGDKLVTTGAAGLFTLPDEGAGYQQLFFLAAGSGITPVYSLLKTLLHARPDLSAVLFYSNSFPEKAMFLKPLQQLTTDFPDRFHAEFLFSNSPDLSRARLHKDLLQRFINSLSRVPHDELLFYICGPDNYMRLMSFALRQFGIPESNIRKEIFNTDIRKPAKLMPPDTAAHNVILHIGGSTHQIISRYPNNILQSARQAGIPMPYSCETGKCGSCLARVLKGKVWMSYNEVLTERDIEKGMTLTCVGFPVGGDVELEIM
ncbi:iron-sulfur cluster-binding domain-containing protein [uncultured Pontibacter sp.]|uniref:flavin reductase family protein n=1 Tax=uncultured Pontibacter sp. TaxID=453356 RepID=UPI0026372538|nr:iron-sulfur cluster-binding domain-containing protein [uncultured Pontibacter sp.]